jgi:Tfp pilus assembly PilM family ATPase
MFWIGLSLDGSMVKWAKVSQKAKKINIELLRTFPLSEEGSFPFPQSALEECPYKLISGLDTSEVLLRNLQLKIQDKRKILKLLPFQIENQLPCSSEEAIVSAQSSSGDSPKSSKVSFYAAKTSVLQSHIAQLKAKNADPDEVSCIPAALWRFTKHFFPKLSDTLILHVGSKSSTLVGIVDNKPYFSHSFSLGSESFSLPWETEKKDLPSLLHLDACQHPALYQITQHAKKELDRVFAFFLKKQKDPWQHIVLTGNLSVSPSFRSFLTHCIPESIEVHEFTGSDSYDATTLETYATSIGLALDGLAEDGHSTCFRKNVFVAPSLKKQRLKLFCSMALASLVLTSTALLISHMYQNHTEKTLIEKFQTSFSMSNKKIETLQELETELSLLDESLKKEKIPYRLSLSLPNVSEVLAWLSNHPILNNSQFLQKAEEIDIKKINYQLIKYPKLTAPTIPYGAKVELEIEIPNAQIAKSFQQALEQERFFIDLQKEISWNAKGSTYFISFFLKSQTGGNS